MFAAEVASVVFRKSAWRSVVVIALIAHQRPRHRIKLSYWQGRRENTEQTESTEQTEKDPRRLNLFVCSVLSDRY